MNLFKTEHDEKLTSIKGSFIIKGVIHILDDNRNFETLSEIFFYDGLEKDGYYLSQSDIDIYLEHELTQYDWGFIPKIDECYNVYYKFKLHGTEQWTDCGLEYDTDIECIDLKILEISPEATKLYLTNQTMYTFDE